MSCKECKYVAYHAEIFAKRKEAWFCGNRESPLYRTSFGKPWEISPNSFCGLFEKRKD